MLWDVIKREFSLHSIFTIEV